MSDLSPEFGTGFEEAPAATEFEQTSGDQFETFEPNFEPSHSDAPSAEDVAAVGQRLAELQDELGTTLDPSGVLDHATDIFTALLSSNPDADPEEAALNAIQMAAAESAKLTRGDHHIDQLVALETSRVGGGVTPEVVRMVADRLVGNLQASGFAPQEAARLAVAAAVNGLKGDASGFRSAGSVTDYYGGRAEIVRAMEKPLASVLKPTDGFTSSRSVTDYYSAKAEQIRGNG